MIISGYPGIGKTSISGVKNGIIDLESSMFNNENGKKDPGWERAYCRVAEDLSSQGYTVFVSSHACVQKYLENSNHKVLLIYPHPSLADAWIKRVETRYKKDPSAKNKAAYENVRDHFVEQTTALDENLHLMRYPIMDIDYDLLQIVKALKP